jgi:hypothetical protein
MLAGRPARRSYPNYSKMRAIHVRATLRPGPVDNQRSSRAHALRSCAFAMMLLAGVKIQAQIAGAGDVPVGLWVGICPRC